MKNPCFLIESYHYQLDQFKALIEHTGWDYYFLYNTHDYERKNKGIYDKDLNPVDIDAILENEGEKYSAYIQSGSAINHPDINLSKICEKKRPINFSHSILGMTVDHSAGVSVTKNRFGLYPDSWLNIPRISEKVEKYPNNCYKIETHPIMTQVLEKPMVEQEKNTLGIILSVQTGYAKLIPAIKDIASQFDKVYIKPHPLKANCARSFKSIPNVECVPPDGSKYNFTDRCEFIVAGSSSLFVEATLRSKLFNLNQGFYCFDDPVGASPTKYRILEEIPGTVSIENFDKNQKPITDVYDNFLKHKTNQDILEHLETQIVKVINEKL